jgi:hypothetical protein
MSAGPVAQLMPSTSIASGSSAATAASGSRPEQHRVDVLLDGELHHQRDALAALDEHVVRGGDGRLRLQQVVGGLDEQHVGAAVEQPADLTAVAVLHLVEVDRLRILVRAPCRATGSASGCPDRSSR